MVRMEDSCGKEGALAMEEGQRVRTVGVRTVGTGIWLEFTKTLSSTEGAER